MNNDTFEEVQIRFGQLVKNKRKELGLSQAKLAKIIYSNKHSIIDIEWGRGNPTFETVYKLIAFLKIDSHLIFDPDPDTYSEEYAEIIYMLKNRSGRELHMLQPICKAALDFADDMTHISAV